MKISLGQFRKLKRKFLALFGKFYKGAYSSAAVRAFA